MLFSVIIPTYNRKSKILSCLKALYNQDFLKDKYEIIVVDDCSTDGTYEAISKQDIVLLKMKSRKGPSAARNFGALKAKGKYLAFTDSDCIVPSNWLSQLHEGFKSYPYVVAVGGGIENKSKSVFGKYENYVYKSYVKENKEYISRLRNELPFALGNTSYKRDLFLDFGGFNEKIPFFCSGEDANLKERFVRRRKTFLYVPINILHDHDFSLRNFYKQSLERGAGMLLDSKARKRLQTRFEIYLRFLISPLYFLYIVFKFKLKLDLIYCDFLFFIFRNLGKLKFYDDISGLNI